ncbi:MAG: sigma-54-dependent Fis family transcriptional regulator, partial [Myxococcales bacterium]|nr:sigma-54-dependent Fis family transcriptional regulator [Myxococcales bacterium]
MADHEGERRSLERERELYLRLLELSGEDDISRFLTDALALIVETSGATRGYIELYDPADRSDEPRWWLAEGFTDTELAAAREYLSSRIIAKALASGELVESASAVHDLRYADLESVQRNDIRGVLCARIGRDEPIGVLYLEGADAAFGEADRRRCLAFARYVGPFAVRVVARHRACVGGDPTLPLRAKLAVDLLVGRSSAIAEILEKIIEWADDDVPVLLQGPHGVGKDLIGAMLHANGGRRGGPFVRVSCAGLEVPELERALLGDAVHGGGAVARAEGGVLFLEHLHEVPQQFQPALAELLEVGRYRAGGFGRSRRADVRVIASTELDLGRLARGDAFDPGLARALAARTLVVPPLTARLDDISPLAQHFCARTCDRDSLPPLRLSGGALRILEAQEWPGNARELEGVVARATRLVASRGGSIVEAQHLFPDDLDGV